MKNESTVITLWFGIMALLLVYVICTFCSCVSVFFFLQKKGVGGWGGVCVCSVRVRLTLEFFLFTKYQVPITTTNSQMFHFNAPGGCYSTLSMRFHFLKGLFMQVWSLLPRKICRFHSSIFLLVVIVTVKVTVYLSCEVVLPSCWFRGFLDVKLYLSWLSCYFYF